VIAVIRQVANLPYGKMTPAGEVPPIGQTVEFTVCEVCPSRMVKLPAFATTRMRAVSCASLAWPDSLQSLAVLKGME
jgi:hypothetical protein